MSISKDELLDFANGIKELIVENGRLKHINEYYAENIKLLEEESIPVEWIKQWRNDKWFSKRSIEERTIMAMGIRLMLEDWEKDNDKTE